MVAIEGKNKKKGTDEKRIPEDRRNGSEEEERQKGRHPKAILPWHFKTIVNETLVIN